MTLMRSPRFTDIYLEKSELIDIFTKHTAIPAEDIKIIIEKREETCYKHLQEIQKILDSLPENNDMSEINIDSALIKHNENFLRRTEEKLVEMSNGCICCTLREDLLKEVNAMAREGKFDYLVIESTGISEPLPVAQTFTFQIETDLISGEEKDRLKEILKRLNPGAKILESNYCKVQLKEILNTNLFDMEKASHSPGWIQETRILLTPKRFPFTLPLP